MGTPAYAAAHAAERLAEEKRLLAELPELPDLQCAWLLLYFSAAARANHLLRVVPPAEIAGYAEQHDEAMWVALCALLEVDPTTPATVAARTLSTLPQRKGGLGLRDARRTSPAAYWAAVADVLPVLRARLPSLAARALEQLQQADQPSAPGLKAAREAAEHLQQRGYQELPTWQALWDGERPPNPAETDPGEWEHGWQYYASSELDNYAKEHEVLPPRSLSDRALIRSQSGPKAGRAFTALPTEKGTTMTPPRMQVALRRRLRLPLPAGQSRCRGRHCRKELDDWGDHVTACTKSGLVKRRAKPLEQAWVRVFKEAGATVLEDQQRRDMKIPGVRAGDKRAVEIVAKNLPFHHGMPLAIDATLGSPLRTTGEPVPRAAEVDGVVIAAAEERKAKTYPELLNSDKCRLVTLACEVGGRWSDESTKMVRALATHKSRDAHASLRQATSRAWEARWWALLAVAVQDSLAATLIDDAPHLLHGWHGDPPPLGELLLADAPAQSRLPLR